MLAVVVYKMVLQRGPLPMVTIVRYLVGGECAVVVIGVDVGRCLA